MVKSSRIARIVWCRWQGADAAVATALANICRCDNRPTMRLKDAATGEHVVRCYCNARHFDLAYVPTARREVEAALAQARAQAVAEIHQATIEAARRNGGKPIAKPTFKPAPTKPVTPRQPVRRCEHWNDIKRFFAVARDAGLPTGKDADGPMRRAISHYMGATVFSRSELCAADWQLLTGAVQLGHLAW